MNAGSSLGFPGGRTLAAWWRQLAGYHPEALWIGYLSLHRLEALVSALLPHSLPSFERLVLKALALHPASEPAALAGFLHLAPGLIGRVLRQLQVDGLIEPASHVLTEAGRQALVEGDYLRPSRQRRPFYFWHADWRQPAASRYVTLANADRLPWLPAPDLPCSLQPLHDCLTQSREWKQRHAFPLDVRQVLTASGWEQTVLATSQRLFAAVARTAGDLLAVAVQTRNWELLAGQPALIVPDEDWMFGVPEDLWRESFAQWCQQRQIAPAETAACTLALRAERLLVQGPSAVAERVRAAKGEAWLLTGEGLVRAAARLELATTQAGIDR